MSETSLRQATAEVRVLGILSEKNLEMGKDAQGREVIKGNLVIKTGDVNSVTIRVYTSKTTNKGEENPAWKGLMTVMDTYNSIADVGEQEATIVRCNGQYAPSTYLGKDSQLHEGVPQYRASFFNSLTPSQLESSGGMQAEVQVEIFVSGIRPEIRRKGEDAEETGRLLLDGWINLYNGLEKATFVIPKEFATEAEKQIEIGQTRKVFADVVNSAVTTEIVIPVAIGKPRVEKRTEYHHELVINNITQDYATGDDEVARANAFSADAIREAINVYNERINELKNGSAGSEIKKAAPNGTRPSW